jgi:hypothetical protein
LKIGTEQTNKAGRGGGAMGQGQSVGLPSKQGGAWDQIGDANNKKEKKYEPVAPLTRVGKKQWKQKGPEAAVRLPVVHTCHQVQASASEARLREGFPADGGVCGGSRAFEAAGR